MSHTAVNQKVNGVEDMSSLTHVHRAAGTLRGKPFLEGLKLHNLEAQKHFSFFEQVLLPKELPI